MNSVAAQQMSPAANVLQLDQMMRWTEVVTLDSVPEGVNYCFALVEIEIGKFILWREV